MKCFSKIEHCLGVPLSVSMTTGLSMQGIFLSP